MRKMGWVFISFLKKSLYCLEKTISVYDKGGSETHLKEKGKGRKREMGVGKKGKNLHTCLFDGCT